MIRAGLMIFVGAAACQAASLTVANHLVLKPDSTGTASGDMTLRNDTAAAVPLRLNLTDFQHKSWENNQSYALGANSTIAPLTDADKAILNSGSLAAKGILSIKLTVNKLLEAGESTATLNNGDEAIDDIKAIRLPPDYNVQIVSAAPDAPEVVFAGDPAYPYRVRSSVQLKNNDPMNYRFHWSLNLWGQTIDGKDFDLPASATVFVDLSKAAPHRSAVGGMRLLTTAGTLRDDTTKGALILQPLYQAGAALPPVAAKALPLTFRFKFWTDGIQSAVNLIFLLLLLIAGGTLSIWVHYGLPNTSRALAMRKRLNDLSGKVEGIGAELDSRWRVLLRAQPKMMNQDLSGAWWVFPAFSTTLDDVKTRADMFQSWVDIAYAVSVIKHHAGELLRAGTMPPTVLAWIEEKCDRALSPIASGFTTPDEIQSMRNALKAAQDYLSFTNDGKPNPDLEKEIVERETRLKDRLDKLQNALAGEFGGLISVVKNSLGAPLAVVDYVNRDTFSCKVCALDEFCQLVERATPVAVAQAAAVGGGQSAQPQPSGALTRLHGHRDRLFAYLRPDTHESLCMARVFIIEMRQDIYEAALLNDDNTPPRLKIGADSGERKPGVPIRLSLRFDRQLLNEAAANNEWTCEWDFDDNTDPEKGWEVYHAFEEARTYNVKTKLTDLNAKPVPGEEITREIAIDDDSARPQIASPGKKPPLRMPWKKWWWWPGAEAKNEMAKLAFVLLIAVAGLVATAQQQVQTLSLLQAAGAVFALGFGADTLKNLITAKGNN